MRFPFHAKTRLSFGTAVSLFLLASLTTSHTAVAGPNAGGVLAVTYTPVIECFDGGGPGAGEGEYCDNFLTTRCEDAVVRQDTMSPIVLHVFAAFAEGTSPRLSGLTFGVQYPEDAVVLISLAHCGDFELPTNAWPESGEGTAVTWASAQTSPITLVYWFTAYDYYGTAATLDLVPHPTQEALFADDDVPSNIDPIAALGSFGFFTDGTRVCPDGPPTGACCIDVECFVLTLDECSARGGFYQGDEIACEDTVCGDVPTIESTWGNVKAMYR